MKNQALNVLGAHKIRITPQRVEVYRVLGGNKHLTVDDIYGRITVHFPSMSLATVYTVLELYKTKGLVQEIRVEGHKSCFELRMDPHHHFVCRQCQRILDIDLAPCPALQRNEVQGHRIERLHGYFVGVCRQCRPGGQDTTPG